jgi:hypothetical protein
VNDSFDCSLLGNAVKFTEKGHILVKSQVEELPRNLNGRLFKILVTVDDTVFTSVYVANFRELASHKTSLSCMRSECRRLQ